MSQQDQPLPLFTIDFEAEETLRGGGTGETHERNIFDEENHKKGRLLASVPCIEYGKINSSPGALLVFEFIFHPNNKTRFEFAEIELAFEGNAEEVEALGPEYVAEDESHEIIRKTLHGEFNLGHPPVNIAVGAGQASEATQTYKMVIRGSGRSTKIARWTLNENRHQKTGIPYKFIAAIAVRVKGKFKINFKVNVRISGMWKIKQVLVEKTFDGRTELGKRPNGMIIDENIFVKASGTILYYLIFMATFIPFLLLWWMKVGPL